MGLFGCESLRLELMVLAAQCCAVLIVPNLIDSTISTNVPVQALLSALVPVWRAQLRSLVPPLGLPPLEQLELSFPLLWNG